MHAACAEDAYIPINMQIYCTPITPPKAGGGLRPLGPGGALRALGPGVGEALGWGGVGGWGGMGGWV